MSNPLVIQVGLSRTASFRTEAEGARQDMDRLKGAVNQTAAELATMQRAARVPGGLTDDLKTSIQATRKELQGLKADLRTASTEYEVLSKAAPTRLPMPKAAGPSASVQVAEGTAEAAGAFAISRMGKMELGHVARSLAGSAAAGVPIGNSLMMEAPRLLSALGPALATLLPILSVLAPALAAVAVASSAHKANNEARALRRETDRVGSREAATAEQSEQVTDDAEAQVVKVREARKKRSRINKLLNAGTSTRDEGEAQVNAAKAAAHLQEAVDKQADREQREFDGDPQAARDKLTEERDAKIDEAKNKHPGSDDESRLHRDALISKAENDYDLKLQQLAREQANRQSDNDAGRDMNTAREEGANMAVEAPSLRAFYAKQKLENGPKYGQEHDANANAAKTASLDAEDAARIDKNRSTSIAAEQSILQVKREGLQVETRVAEKRLEMARSVLANSRETQGAEHDALVLAVDAAQSEVEEAKKVTGEKLAQSQLEQQIANLRGSSAQVRSASLDLERADLARRLAIAKPDERAGILTEQARNAQQRAEFEKSERLRTIDTAETNDRADTGRGPAEALRLLEKELGHIQERQDWNKSENGGDAQVYAQLNLQAKQLEDTKEQILQREKESLATIQQQTTEIQQQGYQLNGSQKAANIRDHYQTQIDRAKFEGAPAADIAALEKQRDAAMLNPQVDEELMTPGQRRRRERENRRRAQAEARVRSRNGTGTTAAHEAAGNGHSLTFDELINGGRPVVGFGHLPNQRPDPHGANGKPGGGHEALKAGIDGTNQRLDKLIEKTDYQER